MVKKQKLRETEELGLVLSPPNGSLSLKPGPLVRSCWPLSCASFAQALASSLGGKVKTGGKTHQGKFRQMDPRNDTPAYSRVLGSGREALY